MGFFDGLENIIKNVDNVVYGGDNKRSTQKSDLIANYFPPELEKLISITLIDGKITDQEKQVIHKKAIALGVDIEELEVVLSARQLQFNGTQTIDQSGKTKYGNVKKCPACGAPITSLSIKCPDCGIEFQGLCANNTIQKLFELLNEVEKDKQPNNSTIGGLFTQIIREELLEEQIIQRKKQIIKTFPIPTTKSDMLEFLSVAIPLAKENKVGLLRSIFTLDTANLENQQEYATFAPVWRTKCEEIVLKAKIVMKDNPSMLKEILDMVEPLGIK